jgi:hypothetical protein
MVHESFWSIYTKFFWYSLGILELCQCYSHVEPISNSVILAFIHAPHYLFLVFGTFGSFKSARYLWSGFAFSLIPKWILLDKQDDANI